MSRLAAAEQLTDFSEITTALAGAIGCSRCTGLVTQSYAGLIGAAVTLAAARTHDPAIAQALAPRVTFPRWRGDRELLEHIADIEASLLARRRHITNHIQRCAQDYEWAQNLYATADDPKTREHARRVMADADAALGVLYPAVPRVQHALTRLAAVPAELGETYAAAYNTIRRGHVLPREGRWITGDVPPLNT